VKRGEDGAMLVDNKTASSAFLHFRWKSHMTPLERAMLSLVASWATSPAAPENRCRLRRAMVYGHREGSFHSRGIGPNRLTRLKSKEIHARARHILKLSQFNSNV